MRNQDREQKRVIHTQEGGFSRGLTTSTQWNSGGLIAPKTLILYFGSKEESFGVHLVIAYDPRGGSFWVGGREGEDRYILNTSSKVASVS